MYRMSSFLAHSRATDPSQGHPFPQLRRPAWVALSGAWDFEYDDGNRGLTERWFAGRLLSRSIIVPFPPESAASTIGDAGYHPVVWYSRTLQVDELMTAGLGRQGDRVILHFGAVDYASTVWLNGSIVCSHVGGHTPFSADVTDYLSDDTNALVVRAEDDPADVGKPRGKQEWLEHARDIWYDRTTGIWQTVWLEAVPSVHATGVAWIPTRNTDAVRLEVQLSESGAQGGRLEVELSHEGAVIVQQSVTLDGSTSPSITLDLRCQLNGQHYDKLLWSPEQPRLIDARVSVVDGDHRDEFDSYLGLRTVGTNAGRFVLNDRPYFVRSVLEQGFWPDTHLASPNDDALRHEVELIKSLGFNAARIHQKFEDPRFLYWADRLGLLVWGESPAAYEFTPNATTRLVTEWMDIVRRDRSHPCIVTWVPLNESWGVQHISAEPAQRAFSRAMADLTRALDPTRPVISNDGWEHTDSDILSVHDYDDNPTTMAARYADYDALRQLFAGYGPAHRLMMAEGVADLQRPVMVTEFGGIRFVDRPDQQSWGYSTASNSEDFHARLRATFEALHSSPVLAGFCYTQLTDTMQEANGLTTEARVPKLPAEVIRSIVLNEPTPDATASIAELRKRLPA